MKKIMVFGTFDIIHPGHLNFFEQAKKQGDYLIVVVARDTNVRKVKSLSPQNNEQVRLKQLKKIMIIDRAVPGNIDDPYKVIIENKPDIICLGYDQKTFVDGLLAKIKQGQIKDIKIVRLNSFKPEKYKSSKLRHNYA
ncbi:MAG TPA: adenylyltransferase/cytidyltransferase family protein [Patescibacteria group bacterium]